MNLSNCTKKDNKTFLILSVFGIIFVVLGHCRNINVFLNNVFPYYSFHMPLFAFISGYFFKDRSVKDFFKTKIKKLLIPYFIWNFIYGLIVNILRYFNIIEYGKQFSLYNIFIAPFYGSSNQFIFNVAAWFVITIFFIQVIYFLYNKIVQKFKINTEISMFIISTIIAFFELKMVEQGYNKGIYYLITRICFLMPFYAIGQVYKRFEKYDNANIYVYIIIIQCILLQNFKLSYNLNLLQFKHNFFVYLIGSMTGIMFWIKISKTLSNYIGDSKIINYIGNNTYTIMMHHVFVWFVFNSLILVANKITGFFGEFNMKLYKENPWYFYNENNAALMLIYVILAIAIPILTKKMCLKVQEKFRNRFLMSEKS